LPGFGLLPVRSPLLGESHLVFFSSSYLDVSVRKVRLPTETCRDTPAQCARVGFPIRTSADHSFVAAPRSLSQLSTSFIATACQGIHRAPLSYFYLHGLHTSTQRPNGPPRRSGITSLSPSQVLLDYLSLIVTSLQLTTNTSKNPDPPDCPGRPACHHPGNPTPAPALPGHPERCIMVLHTITSLKNHLPDNRRDKLLAPPPTCVELRGLEPRTPCLQSRCSSQLSYSPFFSTAGLQRISVQKKPDPL
jgi:hypothetical protein